MTKNEAIVILAGTGDMQAEDAAWDLGDAGLYERTSADLERAGLLRQVQVSDLAVDLLPTEVAIAEARKVLGR